MFRAVGAADMLERLGPLACSSGWDHWHVRAVVTAGM